MESGADAGCCKGWGWSIGGVAEQSFHLECHKGDDGDDNTRRHGGSRRHRIEPHCVSSCSATGKLRRDDDDDTRTDGRNGQAGDGTATGRTQTDDWRGTSRCRRDAQGRKDGLDWQGTKVDSVCCCLPWWSVVKLKNSACVRGAVTPDSSRRGRVRERRGLAGRGAEGGTYRQRGQTLLFVEEGERVMGGCRKETTTTS